MASQATDSANICPVCLESRLLKIAGKCKHAFCTKCLTAVLERKVGDVFACPTCQVDCICPRGGLKDLMDFKAGKEVDGAGLEQVSRVGVKGRHHGSAKTTDQDAGMTPDPGSRAGMTPDPGSRGEESKTGAKCADTGWDLSVRCKPCHYRKKDIKAVNHCIECDHLYICDLCTKVHAQNKTTQGHVVVPLRSEKKEDKAMCKTHDSLLNGYCHDCGKSVCMVCVMLEHGEHQVEKLADVVDARVTALNDVLEIRAKRLKELQHLKYELMVLKGEAPMLDKQDILIKEIEDHAEKCIQQVVKWKEALKKQVKSDYEVIRDIPEDLEKVLEAVEQIERPVERAAELLGKTNHDPGYLDKLVSLQQDLDAVAGIGSDINGAGNWKKLREFHDFDHCFVPREMPASLGKIDKVECPEPGSIKVINAKEIFKHTMETDSRYKFKFINCVANFGKHFAVTHPVRFRRQSEAIDIYEFPGILKHTLKDHVPPLYDMSSTPDGKLAVLSDGTGGINCSVKLFDIEKGYSSCTCDIDIAEPFYVGVTLQHQYVILGGNKQRETQITVADKEGVVEHRCVIGKHHYLSHRISCGRDYIFVGDYIECNVKIYQLKESGLQLVSNISRGEDFTDISATVWDDYFAVKLQRNPNELHLCKYSKKRGNKMEWLAVGEMRVSFEWDTETHWIACFLTRDGHIVVSNGLTIRVFKLE